MANSSRLSNSVGSQKTNTTVQNDVILEENINYNNCNNCDDGFKEQVLR